MEFIKYYYNHNSNSVKEVIKIVKYLILILYKLGKKYFRTIRHIDTLINSFISKIKDDTTMKFANSNTNSYYNYIKSIFEGLDINQGSTKNEESSINKELNELIKDHIFLNHNKPSSKKTNHNSEELKQLFLSIGLDYN